MNNFVAAGPDGDENLGRQPVARNRNNNNDDGRNSPPIDENNDGHPPVNPLGNWQNDLPETLVGHPVVLAFLASNSSFLICDPHLPGNPIIYASPGFLNLTGYPEQRVLGRNCRFLQGPETDPVAVSRIREAIDNSEDVSVQLLNYRFDGTTFLNQVLITAIRDDAGEVTYHLGLQCVVSDDETESKENEQADIYVSDTSSQ